MKIIAWKQWGTNDPVVDFIYVALEFKFQDMWVGVFWKNESVSYLGKTDYSIWICLFPMLPIYIRRVRYE